MVNQYPPPPPTTDLRSPGSGELDLNALLSRIPPGDLILGLSLILIFIFSFVGDWFHWSFNSCTSFQQATGCDESNTYGSLWDGFGILPALLLLAAIAFFAIRRIPQIRLELPFPEGLVWIVFSVVEVILFFLYWLISKGTYQGQIIAPDHSLFPGWALFVAVGFTALLAIGGLVQSRASLPTPASAAPSPAASMPIGTMSPDRANWFDGAAWRDATVSAPPGAPRSEDGVYWWDGATWRPVPR